MDAINIYDYKVLKKSLRDSNLDTVQIEHVDICEEFAEDLDVASDKIILIKDVSDSWFQQCLYFPLHFIKEKFKPGSMKVSIFALCTAVIGAGLIALPQAFYYSGVAFTLLQLCFSAWLCIYTNMLLVRRVIRSMPPSTRRRTVIWISPIVA